MTLGEYLKELRIEAYMTADEAAKAIGYKDKESIYNWESDQRRPPLRALVQLCKIYKADTLEIKEALIAAYKNKLEQEGL